MIKIKDKTSLRKVLRKKERAGGRVVIDMETGHWCIEVLRPFSTQKENHYYIVFLNNVAIKDSIITHSFNEIEALMNKSKQTLQPVKENTENPTHALKVQLVQLRAITDNQSSQIKLLQDSNKELEEDKKEYLNRLTYLGNKLRDAEADNSIYKEELLKLKDKVERLEVHRNKLLDLL